MTSPIFLNFSNHPSSRWSPEQLSAAEAFGRVVDEPFPAVPAELDERGVALLADEAVLRIMAHHPAAVLCQGEYTLAFAVTERLKAEGVKVLAASSDRVIETEADENGETRKVSVFRFTRFRAY